MNPDPEPRETQNAESPQNFTLDPCPVEGFTAEGHHFHDPEDGGHPYADPIPLPYTAKPARFHPIAWIPTVEEFEPAMWGVWAKEQPGRTWEVEPRTVPAEPEDPRVEVVRGWLKDDGDFSDADVRDLLARLDAMGGESK